MSIYSKIDIETFMWIKGEVELTLDSASAELYSFVSTDNKESLYGLSNHLHQVVGSLQMLEMKALSSLIMEAELLVEDYTLADSKIGKASFVVLLESAFSALKATFTRIQSGLPENPTDVVELINQMRFSRGLKGVEISSLFSPMIEVFPEVNFHKALNEKVYRGRAKALHVYYQTFLLQWLRDNDHSAIDKLTMVIDKLFQMSVFGAVARLWWVASAYADCVKHNDFGNKSVHSLIFRQLDDRLRELENHGESALVRDPADELIKIMLFYTGVGEKRTERMDEISDAFKLHEYFPALKLDDDSVDFNQLEANLTELKNNGDLPLTIIRQLVTSYFETEQLDSSGLVDALAQLEILEKATEKEDAGIVYEVSAQAAEVIRGLRRGLIQRDEDTGFHLASALMFIESSIQNPSDVDGFWLQSGKLKRQALIALNNQEELTDALDGTHLSGSERQALLDVVATEVEENLKDIEAKLEEFSADISKTEILNGIDGKIRQVRGALQVLGEQKVGLLLKMAEEQFVALENGKVEPSAELNEALAVSIGTMEEYVKGLQNKRSGMDYLLDRSITDLEVAIGKTVSRDDVEDLLDGASDSLFSWLANQSDLALFTNLKSSLRDLTTLARKTKLSEIEHLVKEQDRLVDVISQEPAFLTDNITNSLQNNMATITEQIITLYGTEETAEEIQQDADQAYKRSAIESDQDEVSVRFHDNMDIAELGDDVVDQIHEAELIIEHVSSTEIAKQHAAGHKQTVIVDEVIFDVFLEESVDVLKEANAQYLICKADTDDRNTIRKLRRSFHTLKGSAKMVGLEGVAEIAWLSESLFNYVLDTEKPLSAGTLSFARDALDEFQSQLDDRYAKQHLIDTTEWGRKTDLISSGGDEALNQVSAPEASAEDVRAEEDVLEFEPKENIEAPSVDNIQILDLPSSSEAAPLAIEIDDYELDDVEIDQVDREVLDVYKSTADKELGDALEVDALDAEATEKKAVESISEHSDLAGDHNFDQQDSDLEAQNVADSLVNDPETRAIFVQEAHANLNQMAEELGKGEISFGGDKALSISIHTLLGNSRTLGITVVSAAYQSAENLCEAKAENGTTITASEHDLLTSLLEKSRDGFNSPLNSYPYYQWEKSEFTKIQSGLDEAAQVEIEALALARSQALSSEPLSKLDNEVEGDLGLIELDDELVPGFEALNGDDTFTQDVLTFDGLESDLETDDIIVLEMTDDKHSHFELSSIDDQQTVDEVTTDEPVKVSNSSAERVAAVFEDFDPIDDLIDGIDLEAEVAAASDDDLSGFEASLSAFKQAKYLEPDTVELDTIRADSLIPDNLTNLLADDLLSVESESLLELSDSLDQDRPEQETKLETVVATIVEDDSDGVSEELRDIFVEELRGLHHELDDEVAKLSNLGEMGPAMAKVMRHLHTIKGSSLTAEANALGDLTHHTESFLESNFVRNEGDLRGVRKTLELYVDAVDSASKAYQTNNQFEASAELLTKLGVAAETEIDQTAALAEIAQASKETEPDTQVVDKLSSIDISEGLIRIAEQLDDINANWKSVKGWKKVGPQMLDQCVALNDLAEVSGGSLDDITTLVNRAQAYIEHVSITKAAEFKSAKALLEESFDVIITGSSELVSGASVDDYSELMKQLSVDTSFLGSHAKAKSDFGRAEVEPLASIVEAAIFLPGSTAVSTVEQKDINRQEQAVRDRAAALRIRTDTLDSLTNFVGDASMNRSQMREDVTTVKSVVEELYSNVQRFNKQLRELEIEADSKITSRTNQSLNAERGDEFDPLELDRYTKLQQLSRGLAENLDELGGIQNSLSKFVYKAETSLQKQERLNRELQDEIMQVRLVSFGGIGAQLRQVVRRTGRELNKDVELEIVGADVRLDKTILDGVVPALEHMLRNSVDHGIEAPVGRKKSGKAKVGQVTVECRQVAREIIISVRDDGVGLDLQKIRSKAIDDKLLTEDQPLNPEDMLMYISQKGFSTASKLTQTSGRGVGMDVVQSTLRSMSGSIAYDVDNKSIGSHFIIRLPISLAVSSAMFVNSGAETFAISARTIERIINVDADELIGHLKSEKPKMDIAGQSYALIDLADYLGYDTKLLMQSGKQSVILVNAGVQNIAVIVETLLGTQEIVVKSLGDHLGRIPIYAGATIRADGSVVLLLDLVGISYYESLVSIPDQNSTISQTIPTVMVVDDSLTVRKSAERDITGLGINSVLAKDGLDAQIQLNQEIPDMILLDIEMPRMDGFELLEWVKSVDKLKHVPVVMVSSRATEKYISKATALGCSAFLGKPYLLESLVQVFNQHLKLDAPIELTS
ncbi:MAG: chemosensory pili system protein ChpA (sensor histidine kinase/response regulator) [Arenicella sp.]|jgi:chemosensory pili system protein ChpA (sensor histidine kinase/response regulator)